MKRGEALCLSPGAFGDLQVTKGEFLPGKHQNVEILVEISLFY